GEGMSPYGIFNVATDDALLAAAFSGYPVVRCGRGNTGGFVPDQGPFLVRGSNLTASKARMLLMACLLRFGALPPARDPQRPAEAERQTTAAVVARYQQVFDTH
ncbi:MAG: asparaginase domain-containing protein, partial [Acidimicrobiales bacterium]